MANLIGAAALRCFHPEPQVRCGGRDEQVRTDTACNSSSLQPWNIGYRPRVPVVVRSWWNGEEGQHGCRGTAPAEHIVAAGLWSHGGALLHSAGAGAPRLEVVYTR